MGLDGGTIPSRADILRRSSWRLSNTSTSRSSRGGNVDNLPSAEPGQGTKQEQAKLKWRVCSLTGEPLRAPILACELGKLYNRSSVIEFLLGEGTFVYAKSDLTKNGFGHITTIKNMIELKLTDNSNNDPNKQTSNRETTAATPGLFVCPVTQLETNGMHQFCAIKTCGHVFSEKALNLFQELAACWTCNVPYTKDDIIPLNGTEKMVSELEDKLKERLDHIQEKKDKKRKKREEKKQAIDSSKKLAIEGSSSKPKSSKSSSETSALTTTTTTTTTTAATAATAATTTTAATASTGEELGPEVTCNPRPSGYDDDESLGPIVGPLQTSAPVPSAERKRIKV